MNFIMKCWTKEELLNILKHSGFLNIELFGGYDRKIPVGSTDRIVVVGSLKK